MQILTEAEFSQQTLLVVNLAIRQDFTKNPSTGDELFHADGRTNGEI